MHCSKGTYIRSIARDLGEKLALGGTLAGLVRETSGRFALDRASKLDDLAANHELLFERLATVEEAVQLPVLTVSAAGAKRLTMGQKLGGADLKISLGKVGENSADGEAFYLVSNEEDQKAFCIGRLSQKEQEIYLAPEVVFAEANS